MEVYQRLLIGAVIFVGVFQANPAAAQDTNANVSGPSTTAPAAPTSAADKKTGLDRSLEPKASDEISSLFENVVAVQRKAKLKAGKFLFYPYLSFDFSDSPYTMYAVDFAVGYAVGEFWEVYLDYVPVFITNERSISKAVRNLPAYPDGSYPVIVSEKAKSYIGIDVNWVPIYGKDAWGPFGIIRSDTFLALSLGRVKYEIDSGTKTKLMLGKTFYLSPAWNLRMQAGGSFLEEFTQGQKQVVTIGLLEGGFVYYF